MRSGDLLFDVFPCTVVEVGVAIVEKRHCILVGLLNASDASLRLSFTPEEAEKLQQGVSQMIVRAAQGSGDCQAN